MSSGTSNCSGQTRTLDIELPVSASSERVDVTALATPSERSSAEASTVISTNHIENLASRPIWIAWRMPRGTWIAGSL